MSFKKLINIFVFKLRISIRIIVTTIKKLNNLIKGESDLPIYNKQANLQNTINQDHRSQFGEAQKIFIKSLKNTINLALQVLQYLLKIHQIRKRLHQFLKRSYTLML